jgi:antitoxin component YwqK of YwqJK toxin-antitoxin module
MGILDGKKTTYYDEGKIQEEGMWKNGQRHGITKWYTGSGNVAVEYNYENGVLQGSAKEYHDNGWTQAEGNHDKDERHGEWKEYGKDGMLIKTIKYEHGKIVKETVVKKK